MTLEELSKQMGELHILITKIDERGKSNTHRLEATEDKVADMANVISVIRELAVETKYMREDVNATVVRLEKLEKKEMEKWEKFKWALLVAIVGVIVAFVSSQIGL